MNNLKPYRVSGSRQDKTLITRYYNTFNAALSMAVRMDHQMTNVTLHINCPKHGWTDSFAGLCDECRIAQVERIMAQADF